MHIEQGKPYAVLTGDIVNSSKLEEKDRLYLHQVMKQCSEAVRSDFARSVPLEVDIFRGDSWQLLVTEPEDALSVGLLYRAIIRTLMHSALIDTRFAIAVGTIDFIPDNRVSSGDGETFRRSGEALEKMHKGSRIRFYYAIEEGSYLAEAVDMVVQLIDVLAGNWTEKQAQAVPAHSGDGHRRKLPGPGRISQSHNRRLPSTWTGQAGMPSKWGLPFFRRASDPSPAANR